MELDMKKIGRIEWVSGVYIDLDIDIYEYYAH